MAKEVKLTQEHIIVHTIAREVGQWLHRKGDGVKDYVNFIDRDMEVAELIRDVALPAAIKVIQKAMAEGDARLVPGARIVVDFSVAGGTDAHHKGEARQA